MDFSSEAPFTFFKKNPKICLTSYCSRPIYQLLYNGAPFTSIGTTYNSEEQRQKQAVRVEDSYLYFGVAADFIPSPTRESVCIDKIHRDRDPALFPEAVTQYFPKES